MSLKKVWCHVVCSEMDSQLTLVNLWWVIARLLGAWRDIMVLHLTCQRASQTCDVFWKIQGIEDTHSKLHERTRRKSISFSYNQGFQWEPQFNDLDYKDGSKMLNSNESMVDSCFAMSFLIRDFLFASKAAIRQTTSYTLESWQIATTIC